MNNVFLIITIVVYIKDFISLTWEFSDKMLVGAPY